MSFSVSSNPPTERDLRAYKLYELHSRPSDTYAVGTTLFVPYLLRVHRIAGGCSMSSMHVPARLCPLNHITLSLLGSHCPDRPLAVQNLVNNVNAAMYMYKYAYK